MGARLETLTYTPTPTQVTHEFVRTHIVRDSDNWGAWCGGPGDNFTCTSKVSACAPDGTCTYGTCFNNTCMAPVGTCVNASAWQCVGGGNAGQPCSSREDCDWQGGQCLPVEDDEEPFGVRLGCEQGQFDELATIFFGRRE